MARNLVKQLREDRGVTQERLAYIAGISARTLYSLEQGKKTRPGIRIRVLKSLGLNYKDDHSWVFPDGAACVTIVEMHSDAVKKLQLYGDQEQLAHIGRKVVGALNDDSIVQRALVLKADD